MRHRARELLAGQRTAALNALRGIWPRSASSAQGAQHAYDLKRLAVDGFDEYGEVVVPDCVRRRALGRWLMTIPGVGPVIASAIMATNPGHRRLTVRKCLVYCRTRLTMFSRLWSC